MTHSVEGIILKAVPLQEKKWLLTLFTKQDGRITIATYCKKQSYSPLLKVEAHATTSHKEIWKGQVHAIITSYPAIRTTLKTVQEATQLIHTLLKVLPLHLPAPQSWIHLDTLLLTFDRFIEPKTGTCAFLAKFCAQEGIGTRALFSEKEVYLFEKMIREPLESFQNMYIETSFLEKICKQIY